MEEVKVKCSYINECKYAREFKDSCTAEESGLNPEENPADFDNFKPITLLNYETLWCFYLKDKGPCPIPEAVLDNQRKADEELQNIVARARAQI